MHKIKGYMSFDSYNVYDIYGKYTMNFKVFKGSKYIGKFEIK